MSTTKVSASQKSAYTFGLAAIAIILVISGLIYTEVISKQYQQRVRQELHNQEELKKYAQVLMPQLLDKLFSTNIISIESKTSESVFGCKTTYLYQGQSDGENQYARISRDYSNNAPIKELCSDPDEMNEYLDSLEGERLWIDGQEYYKAGYSTKYEKIGVSRSTTEEPKNYMANFFSAYDTKVEVTEANVIGGELLIKAKVQEGEIEKEYLVIVDDAAKLITRVSYEEKSKTITSKKIDVKITYEVPEIPTIAGITDPYSVAPYRDAIFAAQTSIYITASSGDYVRRQSSQQLLSWSIGETKKECSLRIRDCESDNRRLEQAMLEFFRTLSPIEDQACSTASVNSDLQITLDTTQGASSQTATIYVSKDKTAFEIVNTQAEVSCLAGTLGGNAAEALKSSLNLIFTN